MREKDKLNRIITVFLLLATIAIFSVLIIYIVQEVKDKKEEEKIIKQEQEKIEKEKEEEEKNKIEYEVFTNSYNNDITLNRLTTTDYSGTYVFENVCEIIINKYSETNKNGATEEDIYAYYGDAGLGPRPGVANLMEHFYTQKLNSVEASGEKYSIITNVDSDGNIMPYGNFKRITNQSTESGKMYGNENFAICALTKNNIVFMSLNYDSFDKGLEANENKVNKQPNCIYVFENIYNPNNPTQIMFSITYKYVLQTQSDV